MIVDLRSVREAAQSYVMMSRVENLPQLSILGKLPAEKIYPNPIAVEELKRLEKVSINTSELILRQGIVITSLNIRSLPKHLTDLRNDGRIMASPVIALQETRCDPNYDTKHLELPGYVLHLNSVGPGKGIATYFSSDYKFSEDKTNEQFQITKISSEQLDILNIYRSQGADTHQFLSALVSLLNLYKDTLLVGDFNLPLLSSFSHPVIVQISKLGFNQLVSSATHDKGFEHFKTPKFFI